MDTRFTRCPVCMVDVAGKVPDHHCDFGKDV